MGENAPSERARKNNNIFMIRGRAKESRPARALSLSLSLSLKRELAICTASRAGVVEAVLRAEPGRRARPNARERRVSLVSLSLSSTRARATREAQPDLGHTRAPTSNVPTWCGLSSLSPRRARHVGEVALVSCDEEEKRLFRERPAQRAGEPRFREGSSLPLSDSSFLLFL